MTTISKKEELLTEEVSTEETATPEEPVSERFASLSEKVSGLLKVFRKDIKTLSKGELIRVLKASVEFPVEDTVNLISPKEKTLASLANRIMQDKVEMTLEYIQDMRAAGKPLFDKGEEEDNG